MKKVIVDMVALEHMSFFLFSLIKQAEESGDITIETGEGDIEINSESDGNIIISWKEVD